MKNDDMKNSITFEEFLNKKLENAEFREEWEKGKPAYLIAKEIIRARIESRMTQKELAEKTKIHQADISKLENGTGNPSLKTLIRLADSMGMKLQLSFERKDA